jgi:L-iditol 2-dehydrogenase
MQGVAKVARGEGNVELIDVPVPEVIAKHVLIEVQAAGVCGTDLHIYHDEFPTSPPVILGHELAGIVAETASDVTRCRPGDRVTSETFFYVCGHCEFCRNGYPNLCPDRLSIGSGVNGAFAKFVLVPELNVHRLPPGVDALAGALTEPLACCVHALELTRVEPGETAVVSGPGTIGLLMAQVLRAAGARTVVVGMVADASRLDLARSLGADEALAAERDDVVVELNRMTSGLGADVVFECSGAQPSAQNCLSWVRRRGRYAQVGLFGAPIEWDLERVCYKELRVSGSFATVPSAWRKAIEMLRSGQVQTRPLVSDVFPIAEWDRAFVKFERREGVKIILTPV